MEHKESIHKSDLAKLALYFHDVLEEGNAVKLTQYCWFNISLHFALRGAEVQTRLKKEDIVFATDSEGKEYATLRRDFLSKNCPGGVGGQEFKTCGRLQDPRQVQALKKLLSKLHPQVDRLFQRALQGPQADTKETWFMRCPLGHTVLREMLVRISKAADLSQRYTNHCLRATSITILKTTGFDDRAVCRLTGHKNAQSLESYCGASESEKKSLAEALDTAADFADASSESIAKKQPGKSIQRTTPTAPTAHGSGSRVFFQFDAGCKPVFKNLTEHLS